MFTYNFNKFMALDIDDATRADALEAAKELPLVLNRLAVLTRQLGDREAANRFTDAFCGAFEGFRRIEQASACVIVAALARRLDGPQYQDWFVPGVSA